MHILSRTALAMAALATLPLLASCGKKAPDGQVVAQVNGEDVTRRDLAAELQAANVPANADIKKIQPAVVAQIVDRKLAVAQAKQLGLDKTPEFIAAAQRTNELLLAQQLVSRWVGKPAAPAPDEVAAFVAANPQMFDNRQVLLIDRIDTATEGLDPKAMEPLTTNDQVAAYLTQQKHPFQRGRTTMDTATLSKDAAQQIVALAPGMPFVIRRGGQYSISAVLAAKPEPVPAGARAQVATQALRQQAANKTIAAEMKSLRAGAQITYQPGFAPPGQPAAPKP